MNSNKEILLVDVVNMEYFQMYSRACSSKLNTRIVTKYYTNAENCHHFFYKISEKMKDGKLRALIRGIEYVVGYIRTLNLVKKRKFDVVHIHWAVIPKIDIFFFKRIKKYVGKLVYTAHDVVPHLPTDKKMKVLRELYMIPDKIIVHGDYCKKEVRENFPNAVDKVYVQQFGVNKKESEKISDAIWEKHNPLKLLKSKDDIIIYSFIGQIAYYKGLDILIDAWKSFKDNKKVFLLIAGRKIENNKSIDDALDSIKDYDNVYVFNERFTDEEAAVFHLISDIVVLPYRTASMSGVLYSAAQYDKTVLSTTAGCLKEYLDKIDEQIYVCESNAESIRSQIENITLNFTKKELGEKGRLFSQHIYDNYQWDKIIDNVIKDCYEIEEN